MSQGEDTQKSLRNLYRRFLVPEESITMKVLFENIKNYTVCAVILVAISSLINRTPLPEVLFEPTLNSIGITAFVISWFILTILCVLQSIEIVNVASRNIHERLISALPSDDGLIKVLLVFVIGVIDILIAAAMSVLVGTGVALGILLASSGIPESMPIIKQ